MDIEDTSASAQTTYIDGETIGRHDGHTWHTFVIARHGAHRGTTLSLKCRDAMYERILETKKYESGAHEQ
jgi:hypothetical protein